MSDERDGKGGNSGLERLAPEIKRMAETGEGTDACLEMGCLPMPVHFYSPVPDIEDLKRRGVFQRRSKMAGVDFRPEFQLGFLGDIAREYARECRWPKAKTDDPFQFYTHNGCFSYGCAAALHCMLRRHKPRRVIEVGSGNSSLIISAALCANAEEAPGNACEYAIIDPFMRRSYEDLELPGLSRALKQPVETVDPAFFDVLEEGDVLFVDSSHTVRTGGDVNHLILDTLPRLAPGVIAHFHDIHLPFEYCEAYYTNPSFRVFWTEAYLLQAFLAFNSAYEVLLGMSWLMAERMDAFQAAFPLFDPALNWANSGSFWIRRKA